MFNKPKTYNVYVDHSIPDPYENAIFVKEGFNIYVYIFGLFWFFYKKMWKMALALISFFIILHMVQRFLAMDTLITAIIDLVILVIISFEASEMYGKFLEKNGSKLHEKLIARNLHEAQRKFFESNAKM